MKKLNTTLVALALIFAAVSTAQANSDYSQRGNPDYSQRDANKKFVVREHKPGEGLKPMPPTRRMEPFKVERIDGRPVDKASVSSSNWYGHALARNRKAAKAKKKRSVDAKKEEERKVKEWYSHPHPARKTH